MKILNPEGRLSIFINPPNQQCQVRALFFANLESVHGLFVFAIRNFLVFTALPSDGTLSMQTAILNPFNV